MKTISRIAYSNDKKEQDKKYTDYDVHMSDYDAACD